MTDAETSALLRAARARWRSAEDRLYPAILADPAAYQRGLAAVQAVMAELRNRADDVAGLVAVEAAPDDLLAAACPAGPPAPAALLVAAACGMRDRELSAVRTGRRRDDAVAAARAAGAAWAVVDGPADVAELTGGRWVSLHLGSGAVVEATVDPWSPDEQFAVTVGSGDHRTFADRAAFLAGVASSCAEVERADADRGSR